MSIRRAALPLLALGLACQPGLKGRWSGECTFSDDDGSYEVDVDIDLKDGKGQTLKGDVDLEFWDDTHWVGELSGARTAALVLMESAFEEDDGVYGFEVEAEWDGRSSMEGECVFTVPDGTGGLTGELWLEHL